MGKGNVHAIDDGRKLCIPTGIVKLLSYFAKDGRVRLRVLGVLEVEDGRIVG